MLTEATVGPWLDVHILTMPETNLQWQNECLESVTRAISHAGFPVALHLCPGYKGHIGIARAHGYSLGQAPYICQVDDDDYVTVDAFSSMREALLANPDVIFPREWSILYENSNGTVIEHPKELGRQRHSMKVFLRKHLIDFKNWIWAGDPAQLHYLEHAGLTMIDLPNPTYGYRNHRTSMSNPLRLAYPQELALARKMLAPLLRP